MSQQQASSAQNSGSNSSRSADYVYFDRTTAGFSEEAIPKAKAAQLKLEHFYVVDSSSLSSMVRVLKLAW